MRISKTTMRACFTAGALVLCAGLVASGQDSSGQSLADAARKARQDHAAAGHVAARQNVNDEEDGPDPGGVWRVQLCTRTPCYELSIALPQHPKWTRSPDRPRPVLIPLAGREQDLDHAIRVFSGEALGPIFNPVDSARSDFLRGWFARPEYFGQPARLLRDEYVQIDGSWAAFTRFTVLGGGIQYRGLSVVVKSPNGGYGFACVFRDEDASAATSICEAIVKSARSQALEPAKLQVYPTYEGPDGNQPDDPADDPPDNGPDKSDDPE